MQYDLKLLVVIVTSWYDDRNVHTTSGQQVAKLTDKSR